jgi:hypothetical protein
LNHQLQNRNKRCSLQPTFSVYTHESWTFGQTIWDKSEVLFGSVLGNNLGTSCEHIGTHNGKNEKMKKKIPPTIPIFDDFLLWKNGSNVNSNKTLSFWFRYLRIWLKLKTYQHY